jgi:hypothetical protein
VAAVWASGCTIKDTPRPSLTGPSEYATSITLAAQPDHIARGQTSAILVMARDETARPVIMELRADISVEVNPNAFVPQDFGSLDKRTFFTDSNGRAALIYRAPPMTPGSPYDRVRIRVSTVGGNYQTVQSQTTDIRILSHTTINPDAPVAFFTYYAPTTPKVLDEIVFNASGSYATPPGTTIINYSWDWGDGSPVDSVNATPGENHDYAAPGTFYVTLTVRDDLLREASTTQAIVISP